MNVIVHGVIACVLSQSKLVAHMEIKLLKIKKMFHAHRVIFAFLLNSNYLMYYKHILMFVIFTPVIQCIILLF